MKSHSMTRALFKKDYYLIENHNLTLPDTKLQQKKCAAGGSKD